MLDGIKGSNGPRNHILQWPFRSISDRPIRGIKIEPLGERVVIQTDRLTISEIRWRLIDKPAEISRVAVAVMNPAKVNMHLMFNRNLESRLRQAGFYREDINTMGDAFAKIPGFKELFFDTPPSVGQLMKEFEEKYPNQPITAITNAGNTPTHDFELYLVSEEGRISVFGKDKYRAAQGRRYSCFVQTQNGAKSVVSLKFNDDYTKAVEGPTDVETAIYGQQLIRSGQPVPLSEILPEYTTELRHIINLPGISGRFIGMAALIERIRAGKGPEIAERMQKNDWEEFDRQEEESRLGMTLTPEVAREAALKAGINEADLNLSANRISIKLDFNRYRHLILGLLEDGRVITCAFLDGGFTFPEIANILLDKGVKDAIILGNGKDVRLLADGAQYQDPDSRPNIPAGVIIWSEKK